MGYLYRIDRNVEPLLAHLWLDLAWYQSLGRTHDDAKEALL